MAKTRTSSAALRRLGSCCTLLLYLVGWSSTCCGDWRDDIGYTKLANVLGTSLPNGAGVPISIVEADKDGGFYPDVSHSDFDALTDPLGVAVHFINGSPAKGSGSSGHATSQARTFFGNASSVAPAANEVTVYQADDYLQTVLNLSGSNTKLPDQQDFRAQNFSWIGSFATPNDSTPDPTLTELNNDREALRRFDYAIEANNITAVVGVNNGDTTILPHMLSHSYNSIAVGRSDGNHSTGFTVLADYGTGRSKPDLVAPRGTTSAATSSVSSAAALLHSSDTVLGTDASASETMKAILLAGASKANLPTWSQRDAVNEWHPLDDTYGAGELNLYNSFLTTLGGQAAGSLATPTPVASHGWDYQTIQPGAGNELLYDFVIPTGSTAAELSIALTWNAQIAAPFNTGDPILANLNLELVDGNGAPVGMSASDVDNVEHLYLTDLEAGTYTLKVSSADLASDFGLAWRTSTLFEVPSADWNADGNVDGSDFLAWQRGFGTLVGAAPVFGDADGDGDVDSDDLLLFAAGYGGGPIVQIAVANTIPEPSMLALAGLGVFLYALLRWRRFRFCLGQS